jgi:hypothetical protein
METSTVSAIKAEDIVSKAITISFTMKKLFVVAGTVITFLTGTVGPIACNAYQKKIAVVEEKVKAQYTLELKDAKYRADEGDKIKVKFNSVVAQMQMTVDFLKVHSYYGTCYILYSEKPNEINRKRYDDIVHKYATFIKRRKTFVNSEDVSSFYLSEEIVYLYTLTELNTLYHKMFYQQ